MNCAYPGTGGEGRCTCAKQERIELATEQAMHAGWRKRAEEAEAEVQRLRGERDRYLHTLNWAMGTTGYFHGSTVHKPYGWREDMKRMAAIRYDGEKYVAALPTPAPEGPNDGK